MTTQAPKTTSRRNFLGLAFGGALALLAAQFTVATLKFLKPISRAGFGGQVYAGKVEEFAINSVNRILAGRFYITRTEDGLLALWQRCPHLGCAVPWVAEEGRFHCPCHGSIFNEVGEVLAGPSPRPLDTFPVTVRSGEVWVDTARPTPRANFDPSQITGA
ncbi:MAG: Rieske (2Fe-2S) protein [Chloroflexi bacterium]|nr:MAG: Rieske (2Fe-2S) protein [Chloroflexota bacterium]